MNPRPSGPKEKAGLIVNPGKAYPPLTDRLLVNRSGMSLPRKSGSSQIIHTIKTLWLTYMVIHVSEALVGCHEILICGKSSIKWRQRPDTTIAVD